MSKGFSLPILILVLVALIVIPSSIWYYKSRESSVMGAFAKKETIMENGFSVYVESAEGTWDLLEYLCKDKEECTKSLDSGTQWGSVSGAQTDYHEVLVDYANDMDAYGYIKLFVRPSWHQSSRIFEIEDGNSFTDGEFHELSNNGKKIQVLLIPTEKIKNGFVKTVLFTDRNN